MRILALIILAISVSIASAAPPAVEKAADDSTVLVTVKTGSGYAKGSAAYIGGGLFITNNHVVDGASGSVVITVPGTKIRHMVKVIATNAVSDIAILLSYTKVREVKAVKFAGRTPLNEKVWAAGYGSSLNDNKPGEFLRVYGGGEAKNDRTNNKWYSFDGDEGAAIQGDSGGPAFNKNGEYIGPIWGTDTKNTYAVKSDALVPFILTVLQ